MKDPYANDPFPMLRLINSIPLLVFYNLVPGGLKVILILRGTERWSNAPVHWDTQEEARHSVVELEDRMIGLK
jgi:hypothetical protein